MFDWEKMSIGQEIDEIVANRVGWDPGRGYWWYMDTNDESVNTLKSSKFPMYSEDWRATGELIEFAEKVGLSMTIKLLSPGDYEASFTDKNLRYHHVQRGETAPMAIVRSFLKATENRETNLNIC